MSYSERRNRKNSRGQGGPTPRQRELHPEIYGVRGELDQFTTASTYRINPDGTKTLMMTTRLRDG